MSKTAKKLHTPENCCSYKINGLWNCQRYGRYSIDGRGAYCKQHAQIRLRRPLSGSELGK